MTKKNGYLVRLDSPRHGSPWLAVASAPTESWPDRVGISLDPPEWWRDVSTDVEWLVDAADAARLAYSLETLLVMGDRWIAGNVCDYTMDAVDRDGLRTYLSTLRSLTVEEHALGIAELIQSWPCNRPPHESWYVSYGSEPVSGMPPLDIGGVPLDLSGLDHRPLFRGPIGYFRSLAPLDAQVAHGDANARELLVEADLLVDPTDASSADIDDFEPDELVPVDPDDIDWPTVPLPSGPEPSHDNER